MPNTPEIILLELGSRKDLVKNITAMAIHSFMQELTSAYELIHRMRDAACLTDLGHDPVKLNVVLGQLADLMYSVLDSVIVTEAEAGKPAELISLGNAKQHAKDLRTAHHIDDFDPEIVKNAQRNQDAPDS